jgi:hypothetical protein
LSISMEEALGILKPEPKVEAVPEEEELDREYSPAELNKIRRDKIILEETANKGSTIPEICEILREKGVPASERTVWTVLHSDRATKLREELERSQFRDIALLRAYALQNKNNPNLKALAAAIAARGRSIQNLTPNSQPYVNVDVKVDNKIDVSKEVEEIIKFSREEDAGK